MSLPRSSRRRLRRPEIEDADSEGSWAISYGDMVTLLLTFFILFFNVNQKETTDLKRAQTVLLTQLGSKFSDTGPDQGKAEPRLDIGRVPDSVGIEEQLARPWGGKAHALGNRILIEFPERSFFAFGKTELSPEGAKELARFASTYVPFAGKNVLSVKAFTDSVTVRRIPGRKYDDNLELSALRAISAMRSLQKSGIPLNRMRIAGQGESESALRRIAGEIGKPGATSRGSPLARKVILVIEPVTKESI